MDHWKEYDSGDVTHSASHYLAAINYLTASQGYARAVDVARYLEITRGSVSITMRSLKERGLVVEDANRFLSLSDEGQAIVDQIRHRRRLVKEFLADVLGVDPEQAEADACKVEHLLSDEACDRLDEFVLGRKGSKRRRRQTARQS